MPVDDPWAAVAGPWAVAGLALGIGGRVQRNVFFVLVFLRCELSDTVPTVPTDLLPPNLGERRVEILGRGVRIRILDAVPLFSRRRGKTQQKHHRHRAVKKTKNTSIQPRRRGPAETKTEKKNNQRKPDTGCEGGGTYARQKSASELWKPWPCRMK